MNLNMHLKRVWKHIPHTMNHVLDVKNVKARTSNVYFAMKKHISTNM